LFSFLFPFETNDFIMTIMLRAVALDAAGLSYAQKRKAFPQSKTSVPHKRDNRVLDMPAKNGRADRGEYRFAAR